jgi:thiol-disulfide isomerase/thioredoxin
MVVFNLACWSGAARAADKSVEELAKAGYWGDANQWAEHSKLLGKPAPKLELSEWIGKEVAEKDMKGKIVVVDFWATWCGPCKRAIPHNNELSKKYADNGVLVVGACGGGQEENMQAVVTEHKMQYPTAKVSKESTKAWGVQWWPHYVVVDRKGDIRALGIQPDSVEKVIEALMKEQGEKPAANAANVGVNRVIVRSERRAAGNAAPEKAAAKAEIPRDWLEGEPEQRKELDPMQGKAPPALQTTTWVNGEPVTLHELKGKVVMLDFWATWCGPCLAAIPHTNELAAKYKDKGLVVIGVCHPQGVDKMEQVAKERGIKYAITADKEGATNKAFKVNSYPDYYFIDRAGNLRIADCKNDEIEKAIEALLAEGGE